MSRIKTKFVEANAITNAKLAQMAQSTIKGRAAAAGTGDPVDLSAAQVKTILDLTGTNSGDVTLAAVGSSPNANAASLSGQQLTLQPFSSTQPGVVTASGGGTTNFLRADGTWATASAGATTPTIFGSRGTPRSVVAATGITSGASHMSTTAAVQDIYVEGSITGNSVAATISAGTIDGQRMTITGRNSINTVSLTTATTNVFLNGDIVLSVNSSISLRWDTSEWVEISRNGA